METFEWSSLASGWHNYLYHENTTELSRSAGVAGVFPMDDNCAYRVYLSHHFNNLVPPNAYIHRKRYPTLEAAKRAVERKVPGLIAVLKIQGIQL
jgi:hypothetical protein